MNDTDRLEHDYEVLLQDKVYQKDDNYRKLNQFEIDRLVTMLAGYKY